MGRARASTESPFFLTCIKISPPISFLNGASFKQSIGLHYYGPYRAWVRRLLVPTLQAGSAAWQTYWGLVCPVGITYCVPSFEV
jgi:hypothetical protein